MLDHPNSVSNNFVKRPFPGPINPNPVSCASISLIEISVFVSINHADPYTPNASGKSDELVVELNLLVLFSLFIAFP